MHLRRTLAALTLAALATVTGCEHCCKGRPATITNAPPCCPPGGPAGVPAPPGVQGFTSPGFAPGQ
jgi:hypothetical protein